MYGLWRQGQPSSLPWVVFMEQVVVGRWCDARRCARNSSESQSMGITPTVVARRHPSAGAGAPHRGIQHPYPDLPNSRSRPRPRHGPRLPRGDRRAGTVRCRHLLDRDRLIAERPRRSESKNAGTRTPGRLTASQQKPSAGRVRMVMSETTRDRFTDEYDSTRPAADSVEPLCA